MTLSIIFRMNLNSILILKYVENSSFDTHAKTILSLNPKFIIIGIPSMYFYIRRLVFEKYLRFLVL